MTRQKRSKRPSGPPTIKFTQPVGIAAKYSYIKPKTANQKEYVKSIKEYDITMCSGPSGSGKSLVALSTALEDVMNPNTPYSKIYITRPLVATSSRDFPWIKGNLIDKLTPYFAPILANLEDLIGSKNELNRLLENEVINMQAIELMRGFTYKNCYVLITESQNMEISQAVMAVTRIGENCKMILEGDTDQKDLKGPDGLSYLRDKLYDHDELCGIVEMGPEDILRHPLIGKILTVLDYKGKQFD